MQDLGDIERVAQGKVAPSEGERLATIIQVMERRIPAISKITLAEPLSFFPRRWQQLRDKAENGLISISKLKPPALAGQL